MSDKSAAAKNIVIRTTNRRSIKKPKKLSQSALAKKRIAKEKQGKVISNQITGELVESKFDRIPALPYEVPYSRKRVVILSFDDPWGNTTEIFKAIRNYYYHLYDLRLVHFLPRVAQGRLPQYDLLLFGDRDDRQEIINSLNRTDLIHLIGNENSKEYEADLDQSNLFKKKLVIKTVQNSHKDENSIDLVTSTTPIMGLKFTPIVINSVTEKRTWELNDIFVVGHSPADLTCSSTMDVFLPAMEHLIQEGYPIEVDLMHELEHTEILERKKRLTIYFDQCSSGWYGNNMIEALQYGIPSVCYLSDDAVEAFKKEFPDVTIPIIRMKEPRIKCFVEIMTHLLDHPEQLETISYYSKRFCDKIHGYQNGANRFHDCYQPVLNSN